MDAARNHTRIVAAAAEAIEEIGPEVSLEEIARRAGVGIATLYRRFGSREKLLQATFAHVLDTWIEPAIIRDGPDPWQDIVATLTGIVEAVAKHRTLLKLVREAGAVGPDALDRLGPSGEHLLARARAAGVVRTELTTRDLAVVVVMALTVVWLSGHDTADSRRYLAMLCDGLRPAPVPLPPGRDRRSGS